MRPVHVYRSRRDAGAVLANHMLDRFGSLPNAVVLAIPRGGVPVGAEIARAFRADFDVVLVRGIALPEREHIPLGAIAEGCFQVLNHGAITEFQVTSWQLASAAECEVAELRRREEVYRKKHPPISVENRTAIIVTDGLGGGFTMHAAISSVRERRPSRIFVAAPVGASETCRQISGDVDALVCPLQTDPFGELGDWYLDFTPPTDQEICDALTAAATRRAEEANNPYPN